MNYFYIYIAVMALNQSTNAQDMPFPIEVGSVDELRQAIETVSFVSQEGRELREVLVSRDHVRRCESNVFFENLGRFYDNVSTATRYETGTCLQHLEENRRMDINFPFNQECELRGNNITFNQRTLDYSIEKREGKLHIFLDMTYKLKCLYCDDTVSQEGKEIVEHLRTCFDQAKSFFSRYDIELHINDIFVPFGEPTVDENGRTNGTRYTWSGADLLIVKDNDISTQGDTWHVGRLNCLGSRYQQERGECLYEPVCIDLTKTIAKKLGFHTEDVGGGNRTRCDNELNRERETSPYSMLNHWTAYATWDNIELYPRHIRQLCARTKAGYQAPVNQATGPQLELFQ